MPDRARSQVAERTLVADAAAGDHEAYAQLVARYDGILHGIVLHYRLGNEVDDVVQQIFIKAWQSLPSLRRHGRFGAWLGQLARNTCLTILRRRKLRRTTEAAKGAALLPPPPEPPDRISEADERAGLVEAALHRLAPEHRLVVLLYHFEGCSYREISRCLDLPLTTVRWRMLAGMRHLRRILPEELREAGEKSRAGRASRVAGVLAALGVAEGLQRVSPVVAPWWWAWRRRIYVAAAASTLLHLLVLQLPGGPGPDLAARVVRYGPTTTQARRWEPAAPLDGPVRLAPALRPTPMHLPTPPQLPEVLRDSIFTPAHPPLRDRDGRVDGRALLGELARRNLLEREPSDFLDLLRVEDLDRSGSRHGLAIVDSTNRRGLRGFVHFAGPQAFRASGGHQHDGSSLDLLSIFMRRETGLDARIYGGNSWNHRRRDELLDFPILFSAPGAGLFAHSRRSWDPWDIGYEVHDDDATFLGRYLRGGGFLFLEGSHRYLASLIEVIHRELGDEARLRRLPFDHEVYHSYYEFLGGFPGEQRRAALAESDEESWHFPIPSPYEVSYDNGLWGIDWEDETVVILSPQSILSLRPPARFGDREARTPSEPEIYTPWLRAATNVVVYALTRPSSKARQDVPWLWRELARAP